MTRLLPRPLLFLLLLLTVAALLPWSPEGPFDARDYSALPGVSLEYPLWAVPLEPLLAPAQIIAGAPDFRLALLSTAVWAALLGLVWGARRGRGRRRFGSALGGLGAALALTLAYAIFMAVCHPPGWRLAVDDPELLAGDLQTHTYGSHDGLVTAQTNLSWHAARGYNLIGITEHEQTAGSFAMRRQAQGSAMTVIPGVEVKSEQDEYLLGLGLVPGRPVPLLKGEVPDYAERFIRSVHEEQGGAVVALSWLIDASNVRRLAALGIDAIEVVNSGHPDLPQEVREAMLEAARRHGVVLLASTDWHGWGGFSRTWTLVRLPGAAALTTAERAAAVVRLLREHRQDAFTPVAAGYIGPPSAWRLALAPWVETVRYAGELSLPRVLAWWVWAVAGVVAVRALRRRGLRPGRLGLALGLALPSLVILPRALEMIGTGLEYPIEIGQQALGVALGGLVLAALLAALEWRNVLRAQRSVSAAAGERFREIR